MVHLVASTILFHLNATSATHANIVRLLLFLYYILNCVATPCISEKQVFRELTIPEYMLLSFLGLSSHQHFKLVTANYAEC